MRRLKIIAFAGAALCVAFYAYAAVTPEFELGNHATDAAALADLRANHWDDAADGTGSPRQGQCYYNTTDDLRRCYDGAAWQDIDATTTHVAGDGADHADVASNTAARHTQGTDQGLDTGGPSAVTAAQALAASNHVSADGSSHADVATNTAESAKALHWDDVAAGQLAYTTDAASWTALTWRDEDDMSSDDATGVASQQSVKAYVDDSVQPVREWTADLSGTYDWKANGDASVDPTSGIEVSSSDLADFTTLSVGGGVITWDASGAGSNEEASLRISLPPLPDLYLVSYISLEMDLNLEDAGTAFDTQGDQIRVLIENNEDSGGPAGTEGVDVSMGNLDGVAAIEMKLTRRVNNASADGGTTTVTNPRNAGRIQIADYPGAQEAQFYEGTGHNITQESLAQTTHHARTGANTPPYFRLRFFAANGGRSAGTISNIRVVIH